MSQNTITLGQHFNYFSLLRLKPDIFQNALLSYFGTLTASNILTDAWDSHKWKISFVNNFNLLGDVCSTGKIEYCDTSNDKTLGGEQSFYFTIYEALSPILKNCR